MFVNGSENKYWFNSCHYSRKDKRWNLEFRIVVNAVCRNYESNTEHWVLNYNHGQNRRIHSEYLFLQIDKATKFNRIWKKKTRIILKTIGDFDLLKVSFSRCSLLKNSKENYKPAGLRYESYYFHSRAMAKECVSF